MGGCRCTFRSCENATSSRKELHYFRFPVRDPGRLNIWVKNAERSEFLSLPTDKLCNKVVCQEHFERKMFMNDLRDRLTKTAIPRLMLLPDGNIFNVETEEYHWEDENNSLAISAPEATPPYSVTPSNLKIVSNATHDSPNEPELKKIKILNSQSLISNSIDTPCEIIRIRTTPNGAERRHRVTPRVTGLRTTRLAQLQNAKISTLEIASSSNNITTDDSGTMIEVEDIDEVYLQNEEQSSETTEDTSAVSAQKDVSIPAAHVGMQPSRKEMTVPVIDPKLREKLEQNSQQIAELKDLVKELVNRPEPKYNSSRDMLLPPKVVMEKGPQLTKAQLFNNIKRYLNPSMVALLRMELFAGSSDRQWKPDEKTLAVDMLNMGEKVYDYFTEEFRFRLPPRCEAERWKESGEIDADDAC
ncbi:uncharacterized protein LOC128731608 [Anopheles nili]|uniref:uncharacterized protein LOC128731608 n=1 Tax=Anopheles nili TaxID=185578 RepID=UPI00237A943E|nr:uncharacterized protein LOC128731608 [Anopheles nili]